ncbi:MAG: phosphate acyltransferase PlsX [Chloroflexi bacterium]|nr:phosphate acyltransferase PlsX [Chloroflexota bacterium]
MIIALDGMGGDRAPRDAVEGALLAQRELAMEIALVGRPETLREELARHGATPSGIEIVAASDVIAMDESPVQAVRQKKDASINVAMSLVKEGRADAIVSAGNTGAVMASALLKLGRVRGIERPALGTIAPYTETGVLVLDVGANADCKPSYLEQFAQMGAIYMEKVHGIERPRVGLFNIGEEAAKGTELTQEVYARLQQSDLNFVGNVEPDRLRHGIADVVVTDGFTGNIAVKSTEGAAEFIFSQLKEAITSRLQYRLAALVLRPALLKMRRGMDYGEYGGAPLLGVEGVVIVAHGRADAQAIKSALRAAREAASSGVLESLRQALGRPTEAVGTSAAPSSGETRA